MNANPILRHVCLILLFVLSVGGLPGAPEKRHPGHRMEVCYVPKKAAFEVGEPVEVVLTIKNVGETAFTFMRGGRQRGHRDNQFAFSAGSWDRMLPDIGNPMNFGGIGMYVTLKAGEEVEIPVDLRKWFAFDKAGSFSVRGSYAMEFCDPEDAESPHIWTDFAGGEFVVTIEDAGQGDAEEKVVAPGGGQAQPWKGSMRLLLIADSSEASEYVFLMNESMVYRTVAGMKKYVEGLPEGSTLTWAPGCCRMGNEPLLSSVEEMKAFEDFCAAQGVKFVLVPSG